MKRKAYNPKSDPKMRLAMERAARDQPSLIAATSKIHPEYSARLDRTPSGKLR